MAMMGTVVARAVLAAVGTQARGGAHGVQAGGLRGAGPAWSRDTLRALRRRSVFFQAEDGIRDLTVTGVQTCALPILARHRRPLAPFRSQMAVGGRRPWRKARRARSKGRLARLRQDGPTISRRSHGRRIEIGRASCRERV